MFGTSHLYVFSNPGCTGEEAEEITYELAQKEIAKNSGMDVQMKRSGLKSSENENESDESLGMMFLLSRLCPLYRFYCLICSDF